MDQPESNYDMESISSILLHSGIPTALITGGSNGSLSVNSSQKVRITAPKVGVVDGNGAGSCFSASYIYGSLRGWNLERCSRFATAQASLKCRTPGYRVTSVAEGERIADTLQTKVDYHN